MTGVNIRQDHRPRKLGGAILVAIAVPLAALTMALAVLSDTATGVLVVLPALLLLGAGLWAVFPRHPPKTRLTIGDGAIDLFAPSATIALDDMQRVRKHTPFWSRHPRLTFVTAAGETFIDVAHLTHDARDILNLIGIRLEQRGKVLMEGTTEVLGAANGIWEVRDGTPFETTPDHATRPHGRE